MIEIGPYLARFEGELEGVAGLTFISFTLIILNFLHSAVSSTPPPIGHTEQWDGDKENDGGCLSPPKKANILSEEPAVHEPPAQQGDTPFKVVTNLDPPLSSPSVFFTTTSHNATKRAPLDFHPMSNTTVIKQEPDLALSPLRNKSVKRAYPHIPSSDTEDDSQGMFFSVLTTILLMSTSCFYAINQSSIWESIYFQSASTSTNDHSSGNCTIS